MELKELLRNKQDEEYDFELFPYVEEAMKALRVEVEWSFWQDLLKRLTRNSAGDWSLNRVQLGKDASENAVKATHESKRGNWYYGWTFRVCPETAKFYDGDSEVVLRVECEYGRVYYGFYLVKQSGEGYIRMTHEKLLDDELGCRFVKENSQLSKEQHSLVLAGMNLRKTTGVLDGNSPKKMLVLRKKTLSRWIHAKVD